MSDEVKSFLESLGARKYETTPYKPSSNGSVERFHRFLMSAVSHCIDDMDGKGTDQNQWDEHLDAVLLTYSVTYRRIGHLTVRDHLRTRSKPTHRQHLVSRELRWSDANA